MTAVEITSIVDLIGHTSDIVDPLADLVLFRGQPVKGNLLPGISRKKPGKDSTEQEKKVLEQLMLQGASLLKETGSTSLDIMVAAQHFGLKTRLLDWTSNPFAALWFACTDKASGDVFMYALEADDLLEKKVYEHDPFGVAKTRVIQPRFNNHRVIAQQGWFTLHRYSKQAKRFVPLEQNLEVKKYLHEFRIPAPARVPIIRSLDQYGIGASTLFPDLTGLCQHLNWRHKLG